LSAEVELAATLVPLGLRRTGARLSPKHALVERYLFGERGKTCRFSFSFDAAEQTGSR
jgi:hypothetical protein